MLTTWLTEIFLNSLGVLKDSGKREEFEQTQKDFRDFLASETLKVGGAGGRGRCSLLCLVLSVQADSRCSVVGWSFACLQPCFEGNKATLYELITSHGFPKETVHLAMLLQGMHSHTTAGSARL